MTHVMPDVRRTDPAMPEPVTTGELELAVGLPAAGSQLRVLGQSQLRIFPIAINGNAFGPDTNAEKASDILDRYLDYGGNLIDTGDSNTAGLSETVIGAWMRSRRNRSELVVATKVGRSLEHPGVQAKAITRAVHASLERLQTETIDLLFLDVDDERVPFEETLLAVDELIRAGKVRYFGASDHPGIRFIEARVIAAQVGVAPMVAMQSRYNLIHRSEFESGLARVAAQQGLNVMPRSPLAAGLLARTFRGKADFRRLNRRSMHVISCLDEVAAEHDVDPAAIAIAWLLTKANVIAPVVSVSSPEHVSELMAGVSLQLTRRQVAGLDRVSE
jgi:aryl-alcohol dehydrogenase-like predicted oxidoreductase